MVSLMGTNTQQSYFKMGLMSVFMHCSFMHKGQEFKLHWKKDECFFLWEIKESLMLLMYTGKRSGPKNGTLGDSRCGRCWC